MCIRGYQGATHRIKGGRKLWGRMTWRGQGRGLERRGHIEEEVLKKRHKLPTGLGMQDKDPATPTAQVVGSQALALPPADMWQ